MQYPPQKPNQNDADQLINNDFLPKSNGGECNRLITNKKQNI